MSEIRYFQRYSQPENVVTNNTLSFLYKLYLHSRTKFENVLNGLGEDLPEINVGPRFKQQIGKGNSVIDGLLYQESFTIAIETKLRDNFTAGQLIGHLDQLHKGDVRLLVAISKGEPNESVSEAVRAHMIKDSVAARYCITTFEKLILAVEAELNEYEHEMTLITEDYRTFCEENNLIDFKDRTMLAVPAGHSLSENLKTSIYYEPASRNHSRGFAYLGLYDNRALRLVGKIEVVVETAYENGQLTILNTKAGKLSVAHKEEIVQLIESTKTGYWLHEPHRFYFVDAFTPINYKKETPGPLRGKKYFQLDQLPEVDFSTDLSGQQLANLLHQKQWH